MPHRLISADDHVDLSHDTIKSFLDPKYHDAYNQALRDFGASIGAMRSNESNQRWREQQGYQGTGKGGRRYDLESVLEAPPAVRCLHAIAVEANLYRSDARVRRMVYRARGEDLTELMVLGDDWPDGPGGTADPVRHRLSLAARAFKAEAMAAADIPAGAGDDVEVFRRTAISRADLASVP